MERKFGRATKRVLQQLEVSEHYDGMPWGIWDSPLQRVLDNLRPHDLLAEIQKRTTATRPVQILEVGCGTGRALAELKKRFRNRIRVRGTNLAPMKIREKLHIHPSQMIQAAAEELTEKIAPGSVHVLVDHASAFAQTPKPALVLREYARALAPGGIALIYSSRHPAGYSYGRYRSQEPIVRGFQRVLKSHSITLQVQTRSASPLPASSVEWVLRLEKKK